MLLVWKQLVRLKTSSLLELVHFTVLAPNLGIRVLLMSSVCAFWALRLGLLLWTAQVDRRTVSHRILACAFFVPVVALALRSALIIVAKESSPVFASGLRETVTYVLFYLAGNVLSVGFLSMSSERLHSMLKQMAMHDALTGSYNRRGIGEIIEHEIARCKRGSGTFALLLLDVDFFKRINDENGHDAGDAVLVDLVALLRKSLRTADAIGRFGGEEFLLFLPDTGGQGAALVADRLRKSIQSNRLHWYGKELAYTVSLGLTTYATGDDYDAMLKRSDHALYAAKQNGRNQVRVADESKS